MRLRPTALALLVAAASTCSPSPAFEGDPYGEPLTLTEVTDVSTILAAPDEWIGRRVLIEGEVREVCEMMGCWMDIQASDQLITVKVADGVIVFPLSARGRTAWVEGTVEALELTAEQALAEARHRAEEQGRPFDETATYPPTTIYRIQGIGAVIAS